MATIELEQRKIKKYSTEFDRSQFPWLSLTKEPGSTSIYRSFVRTLTVGEIERVKMLICAQEPQRRADLNGLEVENKEVLKESRNIGIVLDARARGANQGWLGDVIEASRMIPVLREEGKRVTVFTSHPDMFAGTLDQGVKVVAIPTLLEPALLHPWNTQILRFVCGQADAFAFPLNAHMPVLVKIDSDGTIKNARTIEVLKKAIRQNSLWSGVNVTKWSRFAVHQLQALQVFADLLGVEGATQWKQFPNAYLFPDRYGQEVAQRTLENEFSPSTTNDERVLFIHLGVATDDDKLNSKFYPLEKWEEVLKEVTKISRKIPLVILRPNDRAQVALAEILSDIGRDQGLPIYEVPLSRGHQRFEWTLGAFIAYLQQTTKNSAMIGVDSMPAGHLAPALNIPSVVLGNLTYPCEFFSPEQNSFLIMPLEGYCTSCVEPADVGHAIRMSLREAD